MVFLGDVNLVNLRILKTARNDEIMMVVQMIHDDGDPGSW